MYTTICLLVCCVVPEIASAEYENEDKMYQTSPDHHVATPRLEDFFWTGSGDGPPPPALRPQPSGPRDVTVATTTVIATVYLDAFPPQAVTDKTTGECVRNCDEVAPDGLVPEIPDDRRYWLLTVIQGATPDSLQLRLARLYQKAFIRQQERHLGIIKSLDAPPPRKKHEVHSYLTSKPNDLDAAKIISPEIQSSMINNEINIVPTIQNASYRMPKVFADGFEMYPVDFQDADKLSDLKATVTNDVESWILATPVYMQKRDVTDKKTIKQNGELEDMDVFRDDNEEAIDFPLEEVTNETLVFKREILKPEQQPPVQVHIQNITEELESGSVQIVYVVLVGGRAVPASVAARDMRLVRDAEVAMELGAPVNIKAEPYLKEAEGLEGEAAPGIHGTELWALAVGTSVAVLLLLALVVLLCMAHRKKSVKSASSLRAYRDEMIREIERNRLKQVHEEKDGKLITVVSPSRTRPSSTLLPVYRAGSSASSTTSSGVSEVTTAIAIRRRQKKSHALRMPQKKRVGTTDSLLVSAGLDSDSSQHSVPQTPTSYLSMPSINSFPRGNIVEPLSRILEPVSVSHLDLESPVASPKDPRVPRRQMASQLVRLGSIDRDPGVIGPLVWDLHCQRIKDVATKPTSPTKCVTLTTKGGVSRMRQRFNELVDDTFSLFGSTGAGESRGSDSHDTGVPDSGDKETDQAHLTQARNDNVRLPGSPYAAAEIVRGRSAGTRPGSQAGTGHAGGWTGAGRPLTAAQRPAQRREPPARAWPATPTRRSLVAPTAPAVMVNPALVLSTGRLPDTDPAVPVMAAIRTEIQRIRDNARPPV